MALVLDTGPILALLDRNDRNHARCVDMVEEVAEPLVVPAAVLVEVDYWLRRRLTLDVWRLFLEDIADGAYHLECPVEAELIRAAELEVRYADLQLGYVDASVIALCERLGEPKVATLDRRDFSVVVPSHVPSLLLLPA